MIEKIRSCLNKMLAVVVSALLIVMTVLVLWQVFTRYVLNNPAIFTEELVIIILVWTSFMGAAYAFGRREHMALVFLRDKLNGKPKKVIAAVIDVITIAFIVFILIFGGNKITASVQGVKTPILHLPQGLTYCSLTVAGVIALVYQVLNLIEDFIPSVADAASVKDKKEA